MRFMYFTLVIRFLLWVSIHPAMHLIKLPRIDFLISVSKRNLFKVFALFLEFVFIFPEHILHSNENHR